MPKRPCAIALTSDDKTILCADKFGDVYSLPLIPNGEPSQRQVPSKPKPFQASATPLTVHTKRNLQALEYQMQHRSIQSREKSGPTFEHNLILGHVSMLTDLAFVSLPSKGHVRPYILTADRDEHIRVSRGPSQAYIIENYCLGHTAFISKVCIPHWDREILISGGGDNYLLVWKWIQGCVLQKVSLTDEVREGTEVAVRGIWALSLATTKLILAALDG